MNWAKDEVEMSAALGNIRRTRRREFCSRYGWLTRGHSLNLSPTGSRKCGMVSKFLI